MKINHKINTSFICPSLRPLGANKTGINLKICILLVLENFYHLKRYKIFQYGSEPVLIQRILIGFEAILEKKDA